jgi:hypothetical protein
MAITRTVQPTVIVAGFVDRINEQRTGAEKGHRLYAHDLTIQSENGGLLAARLWIREGEAALPLPTIGEHVAFVAQVSERRDQSGIVRAELSIVRPLADNDLDLLHSRMSAPAGASK